MAPALHVDTNAFYCGARVLASGADPYRFQPLHTCEAQNLPMGRTEVVPMPLPPFAVAMLFPLSLLPFSAANFVWLLLILLSASVIVLALVNLTGLPAGLVGVLVAAGTLVEPLANGAMAPLPIALLCAAAIALTRSRYIVAAILLALACIQPHVALPPMVAIFVLVPRMRILLVGVCAAIAALSLAFGVSMNLEYFTTVLPLHAVSEFGSSNQYSFSAFLHLIGVPDRTAIATGTIQYALFGLFGVLLAGALHRRIPGSLVLAPLACAVTGGTFIHQTEIVGALPFALTVAAAVQTAATWFAVVLIALPLEYVIDWGGTWIVGLVIALVLTYRKCVGWLGATVVGLIVSVTLSLANRLWPLAVTNVAPGAVPDDAFSELPWKVMQNNLPPGNAFWWLTHTATYLGLALLFLGALKVMRERASHNAFGRL